jgi:enamine deaminase RidA (YjgF/YER057c/UK114 family)
MEEHMQANGDRNSPQTPRERLEALGIQLPTPPTPLGNYVETALVGTLLFTSGILPFVDGKLLFTGRLGADLTVEQGQEAARSAALNALAAASHFLGGVDRLRKVIRVGIALATTEALTQHAAVADGASDLFAQIFGKEQGHTRLVSGAYSLPVRTPLVLDAIFEVVVEAHDEWST